MRGCGSTWAKALECDLLLITTVKELGSQFISTLEPTLHMFTGAEGGSGLLLTPASRGSVRQPGPGEGTVVRFSPKQGGWEMQVWVKQTSKQTF